MLEKQQSYDYESLLLSGKKELFSKNSSPLPTPPMLMLHRITHIDDNSGKFKRGKIIAEFDIRDDLWFFDCHFYHDPVMPGCLSVDAMWQLLGFFITWLGAEGKGRALGIGETKFSGQVTPDTKMLTYSLNIKRIMRGKNMVWAAANGLMQADGKDMHTAKNLRVAIFKDAK